ncbi:COG4315 family predicted lipoprotein [Arthrobacter sp. MMS24-S77]
MKKQLGTGLGVLALAIVLSACGGSPGTSTTSSSPASSSAAAPSPTATSPAPSSSASAAAYDLETATSSAGQIVVAANGRSVYFFTKDVKDSGKSACTGGCATSWPAVTTTSSTPTAEDVSGTLGTIPTADGKMQITINGMPIYFFGQDKAAGDIKGQGVGGVWTLVSPSGSMVTASGMAY